MLCGVLVAPVYPHYVMMKEGSWPFLWFSISRTRSGVIQYMSRPFVIAMWHNMICSVRQHTIQSDRCDAQHTAIGLTFATFVLLLLICLSICNLFAIVCYFPIVGIDSHILNHFCAQDKSSRTALPPIHPLTCW